MLFGRGWTDAEEEILRRDWPAVPPDRIAIALGRARSTIFRHARRLGLGPGFRESTRRWPAEQEAILRRDWGIVPTSEIARRVGRTPAAVGNKAKALGLDPVGEPSRYWTDEEVRILRESWGPPDIAGIAARLGRTIKSVENKAVDLGLRRPARPDPPAPELAPRPGPAPEPSAAEAHVPGIADWLREWKAIRARARARGPLRADPDLEGAMAFRVSLGAFRVDQ